MNKKGKKENDDSGDDSDDSGMRNKMKLNNRIIIGVIAGMLVVGCFFVNCSQKSQPQSRESEDLGVEINNSISLFEGNVSSIIENLTINLEVIDSTIPWDENL